MNDYIVKACALALRDVPEANAQFDSVTGQPKEQSNIDISVAVATEGGLITPIVQNAVNQSVPSISSTIKVFFCACSQF